MELIPLLNFLAIISSFLGYAYCMFNQFPWLTVPFCIMLMTSVANMAYYDRHNKS